MKKFLLSLAALLCLSSVALADEVTFNTNSSMGFTEGESDYSATQNGFSFTYTGNSTGLPAPDAGHIRIYKGATLTIKGEENQTISKVVMTATSTKYAGFNSVSTGSGSWSSTTYTWTGEANEITFNSGSSQSRISKVVITYTSAVAKPEITVVEDEGIALVGITFATADAEIYYTLDGTTPSKESKESTKYTEEFYIYESCTIKAVAYVGEDASGVATEVVTMPFVLDDFSALFDVELENNQTLDVVINASWNPMTVIYESGKYMMVNCGYNNMLFYSNTVTTTPRNNGDTFKRAEGKFQIYNNQREITNYTISEITAGDPVNPKPVEAEDFEYTIAAYNMYQYFTIQGMTISGIDGKNATLTDAAGNEVEVKLYNQFGIEGFEEVENVDITGFVGIYKDNLQFWPVTILPAQVEITVPEGAHSFEAKEVVDSDDVNIKISGVHAESDLYYRFTAKGEENKEPEVEAYAVDHEGFTKSENCTLEEDGTYTHLIPVTEPGTFEIYTYHAASDTQSEVKVLEAGATTGIDLIGADNDAEAEYFNLQGIRVDNPENGLYIVRKAGKTYKVVK